MPAPIPSNEAPRLEALLRCRVLDTEPEPEFDELAELAAFICGTPMALVSLIDAERQWFKSRVGIKAAETHRDHAFCAYAILQDDLFLVPDAAEDDRFASNPLVTGEPHIRFYAGVPLITGGGQAVGTLCVLDRAPRTLTHDQKAALRALARQAASQLDLRQRMHEASQAVADLGRAQRQLTAQHAIVRALADAASLDEVTPKLLQAICETLGWEHGAIWRIDPSTGVLRCVETWRPADVDFPEFEAISRKITFAPGIGLPGRVWSSGKPAWILDVLRDPNFPRAPVAAREGLHAGFGFPIVFRHQVQGVIECFSREVREPDPDLLATMASVGTQIGEFLERRRAEEELDRLFRLSIDMLCIAGFDGYFKRLNPAWERTLGWTTEELRARPYMEFVHPEDRSSTTAEACKIAGGSESIFFENRYLCKDGSYRWLSWQTTPSSEQQLIYGAARDVTERRRAQAARSHLAAIVESTEDAIISKEFDGTIRTWNRGATRIYGYTPEEAVGQNISLVVPPDRREELAQVLERIRAGENLEHFETIRRRKDGNTFPVSLTISAIRDAKGKPSGASVIARDITERKRIEQELKAAKDAADAANRAKSDFLANMSHEIRTPMNAIIGMSELALETALSREQREYLTAVNDSAESLLALINDILDFSKIEAGKIELEAVEFSLRDVLGDSVRTLGPRAHQKGLELACHVPPELPDELIGDPTRLRQIVTNLVANAVKFTARGEVVVRVKKHSDVNGSVRLHFSVSDTGIGIPAEKQQHIFESFAQADSSTTRQYGGSGLGLAIVRELVGCMEGRIWVESAADQGSTFHFTARFGVGRGKEARRRAIADVQLRRLRVLVVDDNATNRRILEEILASWGMRPAAADSADTALAMLESAAKQGEIVPLILTDANMPGMDGLALARRIRENPGWSRSSIILLTSAGRPGETEQARNVGVAACLNKPVKQSDLFDTIVTVLGGPVPAVEPKPAASLRRRKSTRRLRLLLAEDNPVNQRLTVSLLEKQGHTVAVANNGKEALEQLNQSTFDAVLMDVQMPEMDGFEATAAIRAHESETGAHVPVIALTAHALKGDRERCLAAGMDAYLPKPVRPRTLGQVLEEITAGAAADPMQPARAKAARVLDRQTLLARVAGDRELLREIVEIYLAESPAMLRSVREAIERGNAEDLRKAAHALKGAAANLSAARLVDTAFDLEKKGRAGELTDALQTYALLEKESARLEEELKRWTTPWRKPALSARKGKSKAKRARRRR